MSELGLESGLRLVILEQGVFFWFSGIKHRAAFSGFVVLVGVTWGAVGHVLIIVHVFC